MITNPNWINLISNNKIKKHPLCFINISGIKKYFSDDNISVIHVSTVINSGTIAITQGTKIVTGNGTTFLNAKKNNLFRITSLTNQSYYLIEKINSNTELVLKNNYRGKTETSTTFEIATNFLDVKYEAGLKFASIKTGINVSNMSSIITKALLKIDGSYKLQDLRNTVPLTNGSIEIGIWVKNLSYQDRLQISSGVIRNISWGDDTNPFTFNVVDNRLKQDKKFPPLKIKLTNFPNVDKKSVGNSYPIIYGDIKKSPCQLVDKITIPANNRWIVAGHDIFELKQAYFGDDTQFFTANSQGTDTDNDGNTYYFLESNLAAVQSGKVTVDAKGLKTGITYFQNVIDVIEHLVTNYSNLSANEISFPLFGTAKSKLSDKWKISAIFNGHSTNESKVLDIIQKRISKQFPIIPVWREGKYGIIVIDFDNTNPIFRLFENKNIIKREGNIKESNIDKVFNSFEIHYGYDPQLNSFTKYKKRDSNNSLKLKKSENKYGLLEAPSINAIDIQDDLTAENLLRFKEKLLSEVVLIVNYRCTYDASIIEEGDWVSITDSEQSWINKIFMCIGKTLNIYDVILNFRELI